MAMRCVLAEFVSDMSRASNWTRTFGQCLRIELPVDSSAAIHTDGLFGSKFVVIDPGGDLAILEDGDEIQYTQDAVIVEDLLDLIISEGKARLATASQPQGEGAKP